MIRLSARAGPMLVINGQAERGYVYTLRLTDGTEHVANDPKEVIVRLRALGVDSPERLMEHVRQHREIEIITPL